MDFTKYQELCRKTAVYRESTQQYIPRLSYCVLGLTSEAGEVAGVLKRIIRDDLCVVSEKRSLDIRDELGDVMWYVAMTAFELGYDMDDIAERNIEKLRSRFERGMIQGKGGER